MSAHAWLVFSIGFREDGNACAAIVGGILHIVDAVGGYSAVVRALYQGRRLGAASWHIVRAAIDRAG